MVRARRWLSAGTLMGIGGLALAGQAGVDQDDALALRILKNLEVNTFRNSLRPAHYPTGTTLDQTVYKVYGKVAGEARTYRATDEENSWVYSVSVMAGGDREATICFVDHNLRGSYLAASALRVRQNPDGHYAVIEELPDDPACTITRG